MFKIQIDGAFGYTLQHPQLQTVMNHQYRNTTLLIQKLHELGHRRVGIAMPMSQDERVHNTYLAAYLVEQLKQCKADRIPHLIEASFDEPVFLKWVERYKPRVIVAEQATAPWLRKWLWSADRKLRQDIGLALPNIPFGERFYSGIDENPMLVGATAVDVVVGMLHRNERGTPVNHRYILN